MVFINMNMNYFNKYIFILIFLITFFFSLPYVYGLAPSSSHTNNEAEAYAAQCQRRVYVEEQLCSTITDDVYRSILQTGNFAENGAETDRLTVTRFAANREALEYLANSLRKAGVKVSRVSVFGGGYKRSTGSVYEPYEMLQVFPQAQVCVYDIDKRIIDDCNSGVLPLMYVDVLLSRDIEKHRYISKYGFVTLPPQRQMSCLTVPQESLKRLGATQMNFVTTPVPRQKVECAICFNTINYFAGKSGKLGRFFQIQVADSLAPGGMMAIGILSKENQNVQLSEEEAQVLGLKRTRHIFDEGFVFVYTKIGSGSLLLRKLASRARYIINKRNTLTETISSAL